MGMESIVSAKLFSLACNKHEQPEMDGSIYESSWTQVERDFKGSFGIMEALSIKYVWIRWALLHPQDLVFS